VNDDTEPPLHVQDVTAIDGFAYGVIGADIHVLAGGIPPYFLLSWPRKPESKPEPSRTTRASSPAGMASELDGLWRWRDSPPRLAARWLYGSTGQQRARLVEPLAAESEAAGWKVITALHGPDVDQPAGGGQDVRAEGSTSLLAIVQHADEWTAQNLTWLLKNPLFHRAAARTRILMVAPSASRWPAVRAILDTYQAATSGQGVSASASRSG